MVLHKDRVSNKISNRWERTMVAKFSSWLCLGLALVCLLTSGLYAQGVGAAIQGTVRDSTGAVLPGVAITATSTETNLRREVISNEAGLFSITNLAPGKYRVQVGL